jgi:hypothetical protein
MNSHRIISSTKNCVNIPDDETCERVFFTEFSENQFKKRATRVSSAPKQPYNRRSVDINRLDRFSRPTSSFIQHTKRKLFILFKRICSNYL